MSATEEKSNDPSPDGANHLWRKLEKFPLLQGLIAFPLVYALFVLLNFRFADFPYFWDGLGYVFPHAHDIYHSNLFPFLTRWDVGHPTLYFWLLALSLKTVGMGPLAGKIVSWGFGTLLVLAFYGCARVLSLSRLQAVVATLPLCAFPIIRVNFILTNPDLALTALALASWWAWARDRGLVYLLFAGSMVLVKIYGVILLLPIVVAAGILPQPIWKMPIPAIKRMAWALSPAGIFVLFLVLRYMVRGSGLTLGWTTGNQPVPIWRIRAFLDYLPTAVDELFVTSMFHWILLVTALLGITALVVCRLFGGGKWIKSTESRVLLIIMGVTFVVLTGFFLQSLSLTARYLMPLMPIAFLLAARFLVDIFDQDIVVLPLLLGWALLLSITSHPTRAERFPAFLQPVLQRPVLEHGWRLENDLRARDSVRAFRKALEVVDEFSTRHGISPDITVCWPFNVALYDPAMGWSDTVYNTHSANSWADAAIDTHPFVLIVRPVAWYMDEPPGEKRLVKLGIRSDGQVDVEIYFVRPTDW